MSLMCLKIQKTDNGNGASGDDDDGGNDEDESVDMMEDNSYN